MSSPATTHGHRMARRTKANDYPQRGMYHVTPGVADGRVMWKAMQALGFLVLLTPMCG